MSVKKGRRKSQQEKMKGLEAKLPPVHSGRGVDERGRNGWDSENVPSGRPLLILATSKSTRFVFEKAYCCRLKKCQMVR